MCSARVHTEELFVAEKLQEAAKKETAIKEELKQKLEEKMALVQVTRDTCSMTYSFPCYYPLIYRRHPVTYLPQSHHRIISTENACERRGSSGDC